MNTTIAKVIAFELGILIVILGWMAFPREQVARTGNVAKAEEAQPGDSFATVSPIHRARPRPPVVNYWADDQAPPVDEAPIQTVQYEEPQIVTEPAVEYAQEDYPVARDPSTYMGTFPEPVLGPDYYDYYGYPQPTQIIILSNAHCSGRRHFAPPRMINSPERVMQGPPRVQRRQPQSPLGRGFDANRNPGPRTGIQSPRIGGQPPTRNATRRVSHNVQGIRTNLSR
jgi:hypothetical protein